MGDLEHITNNAQKETPLNSSLGDYTRKSVVGAIYRVGASFAMDAVYLTAIGAAGYSEFFQSLNAAKLARIAGFVIVINFVDYKFDVTNRLDNMTKGLQKSMMRKDKKKS